MRRKPPLVLYYLKPNRYSFNALIGAVEKAGLDDAFGLLYADTEGDLLPVLRRAAGSRPAVLCVSFATPQLWDVRRAMRSVRRTFGRDVTCIAGGPHPTAAPRETLGMGFDLAVRGEGEETLVEILRAVLDGKDAAAVPGTASLDGRGRLHSAGRRRPLDLDAYAALSVRHGKYGPIEITRGCSYGCAFCQVSRIFGTHVRHRSVEGVCEQVGRMKRRRGAVVRFLSPSGLSYGSTDGKTPCPDRLAELLEGARRILGPDGRIYIGTFPSAVRPEHVSDETLRIITSFADNDDIVIGAQSASPGLLRACRRGHTMEDVWRAADLSLRAGIRPSVDFMFGLPGETQEDAALTLEAIARLAGMGARIHAHTFIPLPQTPFAKKPPGRLNRQLRKALEALTARGQVFGYWREQEKIALKIGQRRGSDPER